MSIGASLTVLACSVVWPLCAVTIALRASGRIPTISLDVRTAVASLLFLLLVFASRLLPLHVPTADRAAPTSILMSIAVAMLLFAPMVLLLADGPVSSLSFAMWVIIPVLVEEVVFRSELLEVTRSQLAQLGISKPIARSVASAISSVTFGIAHVMPLSASDRWGSLEELARFATVGMLLCAIVTIAGIATSIAVHGALNVSLIVAPLGNAHKPTALVMVTSVLVASAVIYRRAATSRSGRRMSVRAGSLHSPRSK